MSAVNVNVTLVYYTCLYLPAKRSNLLTNQLHCTHLYAGISAALLHAKNYNFHKLWWSLSFPPAVVYADILCIICSSKG